MTSSGVELERDIEFVASLFRLSLVILIGVIFTGCSAAVALQFLPIPSHRLYMYPLSFVLFLFSAVFLLGWIRNAFRFRGVVLSIGPHGILDRRLSEQIIPWSAVINVTMKEFRGQAILLIALDSAFEATWRRHLEVRLLKWDYVLSGWSGYRITTVGLKAKLKDVEAAINKYRFIDRDWAKLGAQF